MLLSTRLVRFKTENQSQQKLFQPSGRRGGDLLSKFGQLLPSMIRRSKSFNDVNLTIHFFKKKNKPLEDRIEPFHASNFLSSTHREKITLLFENVPWRTKIIHLVYPGLSIMRKTANRVIGYEKTRISPLSTWDLRRYGSSSSDETKTSTSLSLNSSNEYCSPHLDAHINENHPSPSISSIMNPRSNQHKIPFTSRADSNDEPGNHTSATVLHATKKPLSQDRSSKTFSIFSTNGNRIKDERDESTFVSSYYRIEESVLISYLNRKGIKFKQNANGQLVLKECPFCHDIKSQSSNMWKLYIYTDNGRHFCFRCSAKGSWFDFQRRLGDVQVTSFSNSSNESSRSKIIPSPPIPAAPKIIDAKKIEKYESNMKKLPQSSDYLQNIRKIKREVYEIYRVGTCILRTFKHREPSRDVQFEQKESVRREHDENTSASHCTEHDANNQNRNTFLPQTTSEDHICLTFPWIEISPSGKETYLRVKSRSIFDKSMQRLEPVGGRWGFFGMHLIPKDATEVIVTEGEFDAMAIYQATGFPAISLPAGANCMPVELLEKLERFERIWVWMDDDVVGQQGAQKIATKLGQERCYFVQTRGGRKDGPKDANEALQQNYDLKTLLAQAQPLPHKGIISFTELRDQVYCELSNPQQVSGLKFTSFPKLNHLVKGHRKGELTIYSGPTGIGKTTMLAQLSLDLITQGASTLWGSFELHNVRLAKKLLTQFAQKNLELLIHEFHSIADQFEQLPLHFMKFHGSTDLDQVLDAMEYAVYVYDVEHVVIDNLQFMTPTPLSMRGFDRFEQLDVAISRLRSFATIKNIHISLIIHPRKEDSGHALSTNSIFGSAKATQEADNVIIIQHGKHYRYLEVTKNRFSGDLGKVPYSYNKLTQRFMEMSVDEIRRAEQPRSLL